MLSVILSAHLLYSEGFNVMLYGVGSKRELLNRFRKEFLCRENCIVISGFQSTIGIRQVFFT